MERNDLVEKAGQECSNFMFNMCKIRTKELRDCVMPRCCSICYKLFECEGVCTPLKKQFEFLNIK